MTSRSTQANQPIFYEFATEANYASAPVPSAKGSPSGGAVAITPRSAVSFGPFGYTAVFEENIDGQPNYFVPNVTAHETGHWADYLYSSASNAVRIIVGGSVTVGDTLTITISYAGLPGGKESVEYQVASGDTLSSIASMLSSRLFNAPNQQIVKINAGATATTISASAQPTQSVEYEGSLSANATETLTFTIGVLPSDLTVAVLGGTPKTNDVLSITVKDPGLTDGQQKVSYTVKANDTLAKISTALITAFNANAQLSTNKITASSQSGNNNILMQSLSPYVGNTTYSKSVTANGTETISLTSDYYSSHSKLFNHALAYDWGQINAMPACGSGGFFTGAATKASPTAYFCDGANGTGTALNSPWNTYANNQAILSDTTSPNAPDTYGDIYGSGNQEIFAELFAVGVGTKTDVTYAEGPNKNTQNLQSTDHFIINNLPFNCSYYLIQRMSLNGINPNVGGSCPMQ